MATYREIVYMALDELKLASGDNMFTEDHIVFLADKYRAALVERKYKDIRRETPDILYQNICLGLEPFNPLGGLPCSQTYLRTKEAVPELLDVGIPQVYAADFMSSGHIIKVDRARMPYVGINRFMRNFVYCCEGPDSRWWFKSSNAQFQYLESVSVHAVFMDPAKAAKYACDGDACTDNCDILDKDFPCETPMVPVVIQMIVQELAGQRYMPSDKTNNANDDTTGMLPPGTAAKAVSPSAS